jgi:hypothetical protein
MVQVDDFKLLVPSICWFDSHKDYFKRGSYQATLAHEGAPDFPLPSIAGKPLCVFYCAGARVNPNKKYI